MSGLGQRVNTDPPVLDITKFGWEFKDGIPSPVYSHQDPGPPELMDVISCGCQAEGRACSAGNCNCLRHHISCTLYCSCASKECYNPYKHDEDDAEEEGDADENDMDD